MKESDAMIKSKKNGELIVISGPSGVGKGTIVKEILKIRNNIVCSISYTSRPMRNNEVEGVNYYFVSKEKFEEKIKKNDFLEYALVRGTDYYGTPKKEIQELLKNGTDVILEIEVEGAKQIKEMFPNAIFIFIVAPSIKDLRKRIVARGGNEPREQLVNRFKTAYKEINQIPKYNYVVVNDILEDAVKKVDSILTSVKCRVDRIEELDLNTIEEDIHETLVDLNK